MPELSAKSAGEVIGVSDDTIRRYVNGKLLPARRQGPKGIIRITTDDLKHFAREYDFRYNEELAEELSK